VKAYPSPPPKDQFRSAPAGRSGVVLAIEAVKPEQTFKQRVYADLKRALTEMDLYATPETIWLDERQLSEQLGVSRTPVREALTMLEKEGFVRPIPRRGIIVVKKTLREVVEMIEAWAALEGMAARRAAAQAPAEELASLRLIFKDFGARHRPADYLDEYSAANLAFHQRIIQLGGSQLLEDLTANLLLHVRGIRRITIGRAERISASIQDHLAIIDAIESRNADKSELLSREHTLGLAAFVEKHGGEFFA
jgi:DNA-binding GntR family transcriptional regulator